MMKVALRGLAGRKLRSLLTAIAIVLGVAMVSGTYVLTDTIDRAFNTIFVESYAGTDAVVSGAESDISFQGTSAQTPSIPEALLDAGARDGRRRGAVGSVTDEGRRRSSAGRRGRLDRRCADVRLRARPEPSPLQPAPAQRGPLAHRAGRGRDRRGHGRRRALRRRRDRAHRDAPADAGLRARRDRQYGSVESLGGATFAVFDIPTAQALLDREGQLDAIQVAAAPASRRSSSSANLQGELPQELTVQTGAAQAEDDSSEVSTFTTSSATSCSRSPSSRCSSARS